MRSCQRGWTARPTHYHVLHDEVGFSPDELQELVHSLSYVYQRSTSAISIVAPVYYAHLAAAQVRQFVWLNESKRRRPLPPAPGRLGCTRTSGLPCSSAELIFAVALHDLGPELDESMYSFVIRHV